MRELRFMADAYELTPQVDMDLYFRAGRSIIGLKASEGVGHIDRRHADRSRWAHSCGGTVLHYHFCREDVDGDPHAEAVLFSAAVRPVWKAGDYLCADLERGTPRGFRTSTRWLEDFCNEVHRIMGATPIPYANESTLDGELRGANIPGDRYWLAKYGGGDPHLTGGRRIWAWQYTDGELGKQPHTAPGIGQCDQSLLPLWVALPLWARTRRRRRTLAH